MFDQDYFTQDTHIGPSRAGEIMGDVGIWGLHLAKIAFLIYSGYHGISATSNYRGNSELAAVAGMVGIIVVEIVLFSLYLAWHNQRIIGPAQSIVAGVTYVIGFSLACMGIIADSQIHADVTLSAWLQSYIQWGLPVAPAVMAFGALLAHELSPTQLRARKQSSDQLAHQEQQFLAHMAELRAQMDAAKTIRNMQLNAKASAARQIAAWYNSEEAQQAITGTAMQNAPALLRAIGVEVPDVNGNGRVDPNEIIDYLTENPDLAQQLFSLAQPKQKEDETPRPQPADNMIVEIPQNGEVSTLPFGE